MLKNDHIYSRSSTYPPTHPLPYFLLLFFPLLSSSSLFCNIGSPISATMYTWIWDHSLKHGNATSGHSVNKEWFSLPQQLSIPKLLRKEWGLAITFFIYVRILAGLILRKSWAGNYNSHAFISALALSWSEDSNPQRSSLASGSYVPSVPLTQSFLSPGGWGDKVSHGGPSTQSLILSALTSSASRHWLLPTANRSFSDGGWEQPNSKDKIMNVQKIFNEKVTYKRLGLNS